MASKTVIRPLTTLSKEKHFGCVSLGKYEKGSHWSKITWITVHQRNRRILSQSGFNGSFDAPWLIIRVKIFLKKRTFYICCSQGIRRQICPRRQLYFTLTQLGNIWLGQLITELVEPRATWAKRLMAVEFLITKLYKFLTSLSCHCFYCL